MTELINNKTLPPSKNPTCSFGYLTLTIDGLTFFSQNKQSYLVKVQFWGETHATYIPVLGSQTFTIVASLGSFKTYLIDCKATKFQVVDSRNYKPIGCAFLNWLSYLRSLDDRQTYVGKQSDLIDKKNKKVYYLPFYDEVIEETLPLYHYKAQSLIKKQDKIGELKIKWGCRIIQPERQSYNTSKMNSGQNLYARVSQISNPRNDIVPVSICDIDVQQDPIQDININTNKSIASKRQSNSPKLSITEYPPVRRSNLLILDDHPKHLKRAKEEVLVEHSRVNVDRNKNRNDLDLELIRMRFQMEELVGSTTKKIDNMSLEVVRFQLTSKSFSYKDVTHCDIRSEGKEKNSHWRIYPEGEIQDKITFNSTLSINPGSLLTFSMGTKKGKDILKGSMPIDCIRDTYDVNIISSSGSVVGYLRVKVERKTQINLVAPIPKEKLKNTQHLKEEFIVPNPIMLKRSKQSIITEQMYKSQQRKEPESYFFFVIQPLKRQVSSNLRFSVFGMMISQLNPQKIAFSLQSEFIGKPLLLTVFHKDSQIHRQMILQQLKPTPFASANLTCSLIFQKIISQLDINCQLYVGNLQQINYFLQKIMQTQSREERVVLAQNQAYGQIPIKTEESNKNSVIAQLQIQGLGQQKRKLKTEAIGGEDRDRRLTEEKVSQASVAMQKFQMNSENQGNNDQQNIYLVDLLTRFLDFLPQNLLPDTLQMGKEAFLQLLNPALKNSVFQIELVDIIVSIFQDLNSQKINVQQLTQCFKAYKSFYSIYAQQKQGIIKQILEKQPKAVQRIKNNMEFGTLNESMLWGRALSKVKDSSIKQKLNKFYKISSFGTADAALLLDDLESKGKQLRSLDISNLGMLIKEWVEEFLSRAELEKILNLKQKLVVSGEEDNYLNIRSVADVIEITLQLRLSLWQSLMLIEQIKGSYGCDLQLEEGVIGGPSLLSWIDSVRKRSNLKSQGSRLSQSSASLDPEQLALIKRINQPSNNDSEVKRRQSAHRSESRSMVVGNNDSEIVDIANLLREKDGFMPMELIENIRTNNAVENRQFVKKNISESHKFLNSDIQASENKAIIQPSVPQIKIQKQKQNENLNKERQKQKEIEFYIQIKEFKLYKQNNLQNFIKALFLLQNSSSQSTQEDFFYLTAKKKFSQANQSVLKYVVDKKSPKSQFKGIKIELTNETNALIYNGFLPMEQITDWIAKNQAQCKRTIVIYEARGKIGGKLVINLLLNHPTSQNKQQDKPVIDDDDNQISITLRDLIPNIKGIKLFAKYNQTDRKQIKLNQSLEIKFKKPIYHCQLAICDQSESMASIISLEQLYLRHYVSQCYPLIDTNAGSFVATISLTLTHNQKGIKFTEIVPEVVATQSAVPEYTLPNRAEVEEKRSLLSQIDGIYQSLKSRYG